MIELRESLQKLLLSGNPKFIFQEILTIHLLPENPKRTGWRFLKVMTTLYNNSSILICQNSVYISRE